jgi:hypothetical protein
MIQILPEEAHKANALAAQLRGFCMVYGAILEEYLDVVGLESALAQFAIAMTVIEHGMDTEEDEPGTDSPAEG